MSLFTPLTLPNGNIIPNRIAKAAMEENLTDQNHAPSEKLFKLYKAWADGGVGLMITGNVMIDRRAMTGPGGVVLEDEQHLEQFKQWAQQISANGAQAWMQINHPGRQMPKDLGQATLAPSAVALELGAASNVFGKPRAMSQHEIEEVIQRFARTAALAEAAGFHGVEIHAAHGYLISQFLSPRVNQRKDQWGGSIKNRSRLLLEVIQAVRKAVSPGFAVAVKLNSADFQRGGFSPEDASYVVRQLNHLPVDLVEISGGSYEAPAMMNVTRSASTQAREAYFLSFAEDIEKIAEMPIMVTGGIRRKPVAESVLQSGVAMVGIATALSLNPQLPNDWRQGQDKVIQMRPVTWKNKALSSQASMAMVKFQFERIIQGKTPQAAVSPVKALLRDAICQKRKSSAYRKWIQQAQ